MTITPAAGAHTNLHVSAREYRLIRQAIAWAERNCEQDVRENLEGSEQRRAAREWQIYVQLRLEMGG